MHSYDDFTQLRMVIELGTAGDVDAARVWAERFLNYAVEYIWGTRWTYGPIKNFETPMECLFRRLMR